MTVSVSRLAGLAVVALLLAVSGCGGDTATVTVPYVVGVSESLAGDMASEVGLQVRVEHQRGKAVPTGVVYAQSPAEGATVEEGSTLKIVVSAP